MIDKHDIAVSFAMKGRCSTLRVWAGRWYKPWTWFKFVSLVSDLELDSVDLVNKNGDQYQTKHPGRPKWPAGELRKENHII